VDFSDPGGPYRYVNAGDTTLPSLVLTGKQDKTNPGTGVIYYTVDGTNPVISGAAVVPDANGVASGGNTNFTFKQANTASGVGTPLDLTFFGAPWNDFVLVKALYDPDGTLAQTAGNGNEGITIAVTYFLFNTNMNTFVSFGGMIQRRIFHGANLLPSGNVLLTGGRSVSASFFTDSEIFNSNIEFFLSHTALGFPRAEHLGITIDDANGTILLVGGRRQISSPPDMAADLAQNAQTYNPATGTYSGAIVAIPRVLHDAVRLSERASSNRVLVAGGVIDPSSVFTAATATSNSSSSVVATLDFTPATVALGDLVVFRSGPVSGESQIITQINVNTATTETLLTLANSLSTDPDGEDFDVYRPSYAGCQVYDPVGSNFANAATMPDERFGHKVTLLQDGRVVLSGGYYPPRLALTEIERTNLIYDPTQDLWFRCGGGGGNFASNAALMDKNRFFHTATLLMDGKVLIAGGVDDGTGYFAGGTFGIYRNDAILDTCNIMETAGRSPSEIIAYQTAGTMRSNRFFHTATLLRDGRVLITGGFDYLTPQGIPDATSTAEIYDPSTGTFRFTAGGMIEARAGHQATLLADGRVLISGGRPDFFPEVYDPATDSFYATSGTMTGHHYYHTASTKLNDGRVLVTGGQRPNGLNRATNRVESGLILNGLEILDPKTSLFRPVAGIMTEARIKHTMTLLDDATIFIAGGETSDSPVQASSTSDIFDPATDTLAAGPNISARYGHSAVKLRGWRAITAGTATFDSTTTVQGTGTAWLGNVQVGDRINLSSDQNGAYFEISAVVSDTQLTIRSGGGFGFPIPTGAGAYTIRTEQPYTVGTATFTFNSDVVTGAGTAWDVYLMPGHVIRPATTLDYYVIQSVDSPTQVTLTRVFDERSSPATEPYIAKGNSEILLVGGGAFGQPLITGEVFDPSTGAMAGLVNTLTLGRYQHTATLLANGWVLIVGGNNSFDRTAELYDPATKRFKFITIAMAYAPRNNHTAQLMAGGNVLIAGGDVSLDEVEVFMNGGRTGHVMTYIQGGMDRLIFTGGSASPGQTTGETLTWVSGAPLTSALSGGIALARTPMQAHVATLMDVNENIVVMRGHTVQIFFSK
ncbi:MAG: Kelch repeat-containing protein, partial [Planctomycetota bacterium]|jgi:hypothetical protein